jgi:hypothetical protein
MVDSATTALPNGACTYRCISKQAIYIKHPLHTTDTWKVWNFMKTTSLYSFWEKTFDNIILTENHAWHITKRGRNNYLVLATTPFCHVLCLGMRSNVMLRFMVQALQDPTLCSSTEFWLCHYSENCDDINDG